MDDVTENRENIQVYLMVILRPEVADLEADDDSLFVVRDLAGREFAMQATTELNESIESNPSLSFKLQPTKVNNLFIDDISEMCEVIDDNKSEDKVVYVERKGICSSDSLALYIYYFIFSSICRAQGRRYYRRPCALHILLYIQYCYHLSPPTSQRYHQ